MKFVILCPLGARTGGPEACFQLSDALLRLGFEAEMWLHEPADIIAFQEYNLDPVPGTPFELPAKAHGIEEYDPYRYEPFTRYSPEERVVFVLPEVYLSVISLFLGKEVMIWWLSVDNAFKALGGINLNFLRHPSIRHAAQSRYAEGFLQAVGLDPRRLTDYTVVPRGDAGAVSQRPLRVALNAGNKVIVDLDAISALIEAYCPGVEIVRIAGLPREKVYEIFSTSRVFIDLGNFPGKDRMAREALLLGAAIILGNSGAGANEEDFPIARMYRPDVYAYPQIAGLAAHMALHPEAHASRFHSARQTFLDEKGNFDAEVLELASAYFGR
ncbi:hypothetical protein [Thauera sinica]|uniref:Glycosyltransferase n=1 Tax=Thauera sinica TaxID=2665146 RepID=A0ABW1AP50_9RHOO|nr:hypothetical protein [Thauera sp. K11]ATE59442.1 hypothetical protein CCZ27_05315 [Thauera sp. K11]